MADRVGQQLDNYRLKHPNIVQILDFGVEGRTPFIVMEYAPNGTLRQRHPKGTRVPLPTIVSYVKQVASALQYAHDERLVHRDVKPENMLIGVENRVLLSDFGIATIAHGTSSRSVETTPTWPQNRYKRIRARPVINIPWVWWSTSGCAETALSTAH